MANYFPPIPIYPKNYDSDETLFMVHNTSETITTEENLPWSEEISIKPVAENADEIWAENGYANIEGELFYYSSVEKDSNGKINKFKRCTRNLGGIHTKKNSAGAEVRGFVIAEHHNQLMQAIIKTEKFIGSNNTEDKETLDWRIRNLQQLDVIFDDFSCPDVVFDFYIIENNSVTGILAQYTLTITGVFTSFRLDFGDGEYTTTTTSGTHRYSLNSTVDPVLSLSNSKCTVIQTPIKRDVVTEPTPQATTTGLEIPIPTLPSIPPVIFPNIPIPSLTPQIPPIVFPCLDIGPIGPINIPSIISITPNITIPSLVSFTPLPSFPSLVSFTPFPNIPPVVSFVIPSFSIPSTIFIPEINIPSTITGFPSTSFPSIVSFTPIPNIPPTISIVVPEINFPNIKFDVPNITFPTVKFDVPSITFPNVKFDIPSITFPDIKFNVPNITFPNVKFDVPTITFPNVKFDVPNFNFPPISIPPISIPSFSMPSFSIPSFSFPSITFPKIEINVPEFPKIGIDVPEFPDIKFAPPPPIPDIKFGPPPNIPDIKVNMPTIPDIGVNMPTIPDINVNVPPIPPITFGPLPPIPNAINFGPAPTFPNAIFFGPAPTFPNVITFLGAPNIPTVIGFGANPLPNTIPLVVTGPIIPRTINITGPTPAIPNTIKFSNNPNIPATITFGPVTLGPVGFGPVSFPLVQFGTPPTVSCVVTVQCPTAPSTTPKFSAPTDFFNSESIYSPFENVEIQSQDIGIPSEIIIKVPEIPDVKIIHDIPTMIRIEKIKIPDIKILGPETPIPTEIKINAAGVPSTIELISSNLPSTIRFDTSGLPSSIKLEMPSFMPSIKIDASGIPDKIQVVGIPSSIELVGAPSEIKLVLPEKPEIEMVYRGAPIDVKINLDFTKLTGENGDQPCFALVPCNKPA